MGFRKSLTAGGRRGPPTAEDAPKRKPCLSDLPNAAHWSIIGPLIPVHTVGRPRTYDMRVALYALPYFNRPGCQ